jgi:hypothetical protein
VGDKISISLAANMTSAFGLLEKLDCGFASWISSLPVLDLIIALCYIAFCSIPPREQFPKEVISYPIYQGSF